MLHTKFRNPLTNHENCSNLYPSDQVLRPNVIYKALDISSGSFPYLWWLFVKFPNRSGNETQHSRKIHYVSPVPSISKFIEING